MRKITKGSAPESFKSWVRRKPHDMDENQWFKELYERKEWGVLNELAYRNAQDQYFLCAYCSCRITGEIGQSGNTVNEHIEPRSVNPNRSLDFNNIVASCSTKRQCDDAHKNQLLPLTPLMDECEHEVEYFISGEVRGMTDRAIEMIRVLKLGSSEAENKALVNKRKQLAESLLLSHGFDVQDPVMDDDELLEELMRDLASPRDGKLESFSPAAIGILKKYLSNS